MSPSVVLVGLPGAGKTTIGKRVAQQLAVDYADTDHLIEDLYNGRSCGEVFSTLGERDFRTVEAQVIADALAHRSGVIALGGGAVVTPSTRELLQHYPVVFLHISVREGVRRVKRSQTRPLLDVPDPQAKYQQLFDTRLPLYQEVATRTVHCDGKDARNVANEIVQWIRESEVATTP